MVFELLEHAKRIGFISTRIAGTDGVSLEIGKWADVLEAAGHECFYVCGLSDRPAEKTRLIPEAHFAHPVIDEINRQCFGRELRRPEVTSEIHEMAWVIKQKLHNVLRELRLDLVIAENCLTIPMNIPLGLALVETLMETGVPCIAHHHDFCWERERFTVNAVEDYLHAAFPPAIGRFQHVVINTIAAREFSRRIGLSCRVIPNVMDFERPPEEEDDYASEFRRSLGIAPEDRMILQPTRIVHRKGIEHSIELVRRLEDPRCRLVITHASGDEGDEYARRVLHYARLLGVDLILADSIVRPQRGASTGGPTFAVWDAFRSADLVTYPSTYEGFGNAFLEAVYFKQPILCNRYAIYRTDIEPCGFQVCLMDGYLTDDTVEDVRRLLDDSEHRRQMVEHNYQVAQRYFSYGRLAAELQAMMAKPQFASA
ncbi:MAG: glycosyltransferase family 4 protein, partial [Planctomycetes bacterium]|nr:glycosyltransferase family 4 protein [Planctomycetota bacterium]